MERTSKSALIIGRFVSMLHADGSFNPDVGIKTMRMWKIFFAGIAGAALVTCGVVTFLFKDHEVRMERTGEALRYFADDGTEFTNAAACVAHCLDRRVWNLRNTVRISAGVSVGTNDLQYLADLMCYHHIYPTTLEWQTDSGKSIQPYRSGPFLEEFSRQGQRNAPREVGRDDPEGL